jgi:hypothetical protein
MILLGPRQRVTHSDEYHNTVLEYKHIASHSATSSTSTLSEMPINPSLKIPDLIRSTLGMESNTPPTSPRGDPTSDIPSQPSTLRRKSAQVFEKSMFSSSNPFEADTFEFVDQRLPTVGMKVGRGRAVGQQIQALENVGNRQSGEKDGMNEVGEEKDEENEEGVHVSNNSPRPFRHTFSPKSTAASPRISTLRRNTEELFSGSRFARNPFEPDEHELEQSSPTFAVCPSTLRRRTEELFTGSGYSANPLDPDDDELKPSSSNHAVRLSTLRRKTHELFSSSEYSSNLFDLDEDEPIESSPAYAAQNVSSYSLRVLPVKRAELTFGMSRVSVEAGIEKPTDDETKAVEKSSKQYVEVQKDSLTRTPRLSTLKRESSALLAQQGYSSTNVWDADDEEFVQKLETMRLDLIERVLRNPLKSFQSSTSSSKNTSPVRGKDNVAISRQASPSIGRVRNGPFASTGNLPSQTNPTLPLISIFDSQKGTPKDYTIGTKDGGPALSTWDAEDDELDRWPDRQDLANAVKSFSVQCGTFNGTSRSRHVIISPKPHNQTPSAIDEDLPDDIPRLRSANLTEQEHSDLMHELLDKTYGNPDGLDAHDEVLQQFYLCNCPDLPHSHAAGYPHLLDQKSYLADSDPIVQTALPRLADAVVTVLYLTSPACLASFLDPEVRVFEWRCDGNCLMIRRDGTHVVVGTYHNFGTCYVWTYFVQSRISDTGAWKEVYAAAAQVSTPISARGVEFGEMVEGEGVQGVDPRDEKYALHMGRLLGRFLLKWSVWDFRAWRRWSVEWEADGVVVNAREWAYEVMRMAKDEEE